MTAANIPPTKPPAEVHPMQALLEQGGYDMPQRGDIREGTVLSVGPNEIIIDLGLKREGIVPASDLARLDKDTIEEIKEGTTWPVYILQPSDREGNLIVSLSRAQQEKDWVDAQHLMERNEIFEGKVSGYNAGGIEVIFGKLRGFVPASHISTLPRNATPEERKEKLSTYVGKTIPLKVVEVDRRRRRLIMSERAARRRWQREHRKQLLDELQPGDVRSGTVRSLSDFGVFIDLGGADGLVHISELAWFPVGHPSEVVKVGDEVQVKVLRIDKQRERIGLSIKRVLPDPWSTVEEDYKVSELVEAVVTRVVDFGAFVRLRRTGVEGLLHVSEMADITPDHPQNLVSPGDLLLLRVLRVEPERRRIGLSLRQVTETEWAEWAATYHQQAQEAQAAAEAQAAEAAAAAAHGEEEGEGLPVLDESEEQYVPLASDVAEDEVAEEAGGGSEQAEPAAEGQDAAVALGVSRIEAAQAEPAEAADPEAVQPEPAIRLAPEEQVSAEAESGAGEAEVGGEAESGAAAEAVGEAEAGDEVPAQDLGETEEPGEGEAPAGGADEAPEAPVP